MGIDNNSKEILAGKTFQFSLAKTKEDLDQEILQ